VQASSKFEQGRQNTLSVTVLDVLPPGVGLVTEIPIDPEFAMSLAVIGTVNSKGLMNVAGREPKLLPA